jgi:hypothetical protein
MAKKKKKHPPARIFPVTTRFQRMARRRGAMPRDKAIAQAKAEIETAKDTFDDWLDTQVTELARLLKQARAIEAQLQSVNRANLRSGELRDAAMTLGFELISFIAGSLCTVLESAAAGDYHADSIECHMDALSLARQRGYRYLKPEQVPELTNGLHRVAKRNSA